MARDKMYRDALNEDDGAKAALRRAGYASGGTVSDAKQDRRAIAAGVHKHEAHLHKGESETKLARGGHPAARGGARTKVVVNAGGDPGAKQAAMQQGMQLGARMAAQRMQQARQPMGPGPAPGGPPSPMAGPMPPQPGGGPAAATMGAKRGGGIKERRK